MTAFVSHYEISVRTTVVVLTMVHSNSMQRECFKAIILFSQNCSDEVCKDKLLFISITIAHVTPVYEGGW